MNINPKKSSLHVYDYVVVGSGLSGLLMTAALSRVTQNVLLLEAADTFGGVNQKQETAVGTINNGFRFLPDTDLSRKSMAFLSALFGESMEFRSVENAPVTYESGGLRPFVGFGNTPPTFYEEFSYFLSQQRLQCETHPYQWVEQLFEKSQADFIPRSYVTKFVEEGGKITRALINGQKNILGHNFIYCGPIQSLSILLPESGLSVRHRQKLSKAKYWTALCLDLVHSQLVAEPEKLHILNGTTQDDVGPCVGQFSAMVTSSPTAENPNEEKLQLSQWVSFIDNESAEDAEQIALTLKKIKRQIKRAYPTALDNLKSERILVTPSIGGNGEIKLNANQSLPNLPNFWIASGTLSTQKNLLGCLQQVELVCGALGFHPAGIELALPNERDLSEDLGDEAAL